MPAAEDRILANLLAEAAREASAIAVDFARRGFRRWTKAQASPVTEADIAIDKHLSTRLREARPDFGWLSEESADDPARLDRREVFIIDPIDGTRAFADGRDDWTVSLAVVRDGRPVAAALAEPAAGRLFVAALGHGAAIDGRPLSPSGRADLEGARLVGPKPMIERHAGAGAILLPKVHSLALRMAKVAIGEVDAGFASPYGHDWDLAAADLLVHEAGAMMTDFVGARPIYNRPRPVHEALVAAGIPLHDVLVARARQG